MYQADSVRVKISLLHCVKDSLNMHLTYANLKIDNLKDPNLAQFLWMLVLMPDLVQDPRWWFYRFFYVLQEKDQIFKTTRTHHTYPIENLLPKLFYIVFLHLFIKNVKSFFVFASLQACFPKHKLMHLVFLTRFCPRYYFIDFYVIISKQISEFLCVFLLSFSWDSHKNI
jgi:hypothetical protein